MRLFPLLAFASLSAVAATAQAQSVAGAAGPEQAQSVVALQANSLGCPVGFEARHAADGGLVSVSPSSRHHEQGYRLIFAPGEGRAIAQATVTLHGLAGAHVIPAGEKPGAETAESFNVSPSWSAKHLFQSTVFTQKLTGVQWVELNELTYVDGTKWHESAVVTCRVSPIGYMLVAAGR